MISHFFHLQLTFKQLFPNYSISYDTVTWIDQNKLIINVEKSRCVTIGSRNKTLNSIFDLTIKGTKLKQVTEVNLLGVNIDQNLTWNNHCAAISKKISKQLGLIKRLRAFLPLHIVSNLYFPLIQSHIDYCITVWGNCAKTHISIILTFIPVLH